MMDNAGADPHADVPDPFADSEILNGMSVNPSDYGLDCRPRAVVSGSSEPDAFDRSFDEDVPAQISEASPARTSTRGDAGADTSASADGGQDADADAEADAGTGLGGLTSEELVADIRRNVSCIAFCHARVIALIDEVEQRGLWAQWVGVTSLPQWVMHIAAVSAHTAREYVRVMIALREMPKVKESLGEGNVSFSKVREVTRLVGRIPDEDALRLADLSTGSQIGVVARNYLQLSASNETSEAPRFLPSDSVSMRTTEPGRTRITIDLEEDEAAEISSMLEAARHALEQQAVTDGLSDEGSAECPQLTTDTKERDGERDEKPPYEPISQVMCLMEIVHAFPRAGSASTVDVDRARMLVHASAEVVTRSGARAEVEDSSAVGDASSVEVDAKKDATCRVDGFGGITSATAQRLTCEALISGAIKDADGDVLMLGRSKRLVSRRQRLALSARDIGCQFPGCLARRRCDAHHLRPWSQGGATDLDNLILLCRTHHTAVHKYELNISRTSAPFAGTLGGQAAFAFFLPDGSQLLPLEEGKRGRQVFDTARLVEAAEEAVSKADPSTLGGGYGFSLDYCIAWMFEAEWRHARADNAAA
ncbi:MAG: HNH endonuclease [Brevibacterium sp.]|uniref:HNH endonuclease signature motif containing protein n=1 Tax=Brevibacterium sp. TaxID=1701 RepID=UPI0026473227|nr:HNH endonuclease signature motif containing protein [Brevibacterium sp.]MDN5805608.1 HNH endonuclease [Brevibacterium sp.]MDN5832343.1 HNH endonuclease [Brevibacterium sp.]MDN5877589.1 HNH endonuclease [Brevibacterium sp.]MDN5908353.1 HNH endonuclease [Brevibacterium sp.]MDN6133371.1 HNH endonuclease [Brevibacterium sp.]